MLYVAESLDMKESFGNIWNQRFFFEAHVVCSLGGRSFCEALGGPMLEAGGPS